MSEPIALVKAGGDGEVIAFACGKCGTVAGSPRDNGSVEGAFKVAAAHCACYTCGGPREQPLDGTCDACRLKQREDRQTEADAREATRFAKAKKVSPDEIEADAWAYDPSERLCGDGYGELTDMLAGLDDIDQDDLPEYLWACTSSSPRIDAADFVRAMLENACEDQHDEAFEQLNGVDELRAEVTAAVDRWNAKQTTRSYEVDYSTAIVLASVDAKAVA